MGQFSEGWKMADVVPVFKQGGKMNQRIIELSGPREMQVQIQKHAIFENPEDDKEITTANRFVRNKLCQTNAISIYDRVTGSAEKGEVVKVIYLDFRKTSVTGLCDILIRNLSKHRLDESSAKKFKSCTGGSYQQFTISLEQWCRWDFVGTCPGSDSSQYFYY